MTLRLDHTVYGFAGGGDRRMTRGRHRAEVALPASGAVQRRSLVRRHPVLLSLGVAWLLFALGAAGQVTGADHGGAGEWFQIFGATFGVPIFFALLIGVPLVAYCWICKKITDRFPGATALVISWGAGRAAATGHLFRAMLYGGGAVQSAKVASQQRGENWHHGLLPQVGQGETPEAQAYYQELLANRFTPEQAAQCVRNVYGSQPQQQWSPTPEAWAAGAGVLAGHAANLRAQRKHERAVEDLMRQQAAMQRQQAKTAYRAALREWEQTPIDKRPPRPTGMEYGLGPGY